MSKVYLDASFIIVLKSKSHEYHSDAVRLMASFFIRGDELFISTLGFDEVWYILKRQLKQLNCKTKEIEDIIQELLKDLEKQGVKFIQFERLCCFRGVLLATIFGRKYNLQPRDAFHLAIMQDHRIRQIATFDSDYDDIPSLTSLSSN